MLTFKVYLLSNYAPECSSLSTDIDFITGWHHVAGVYNNDTDLLSLYMDGERLTTLDASSEVLDMVVDNSGDGLRVGNTFKAMTDEIRVSDNVRYTGSTYTLPSLPFEPDEHTRALWHFDEEEGSTEFHDACGEDNMLIGYKGAHTKGVMPTQVHVNTKIPQEYKLLQNYPNPFNPKTTIPFSVKERCHVLLQVYDILGREVMTLVDDSHEPGFYRLTFDARHLPSGLYLYRIQMKDFQAVKKMVVME